MIDLTGANLIAYLLRVVKDVMRKNPRFRRALGEVTFDKNNTIYWNDLRIIVKNVTTAGTRLSPDYFMCTQHGRAILCKVADKDGLFVEWVSEYDKTRQTPPAGVYYLNVDSVDEETQAVGLTVQQYSWTSGSLKNAIGSVVYLRSGIDGTTLTATDLAAGGAPVTTEAYVDKIFLLSACKTLQLYAPGNIALVPFVDFWYQRMQDIVIIPATRGGPEVANILQPYTSIQLIDQDGYVLRQDLDWRFYNGPSWIITSQSTPPGSTISARCMVKVNPALVSGTNPENIINAGASATQPLIAGQGFIHATSGDYLNLTANPDGTITLPVLLKPGECMTWEFRTDAGQKTLAGKKYDLNGNMLPGLYIAIGDNVVVGDQAAIIVSQNLTETYQVYGSKENLSFTLSITANDNQTASDFCEMLKAQLLILGRTNMEADGLTIFEATRTYEGLQRDPSGTAMSYSYQFTVSAAADWKVFIPLITRMVRWELIDEEYTDFPGKVQEANRAQSFGAFQFLPSYA